MLLAHALTPAMLKSTACVPAAACCTLRAISCVAEPCCSTATAMVAAISLISLIVVPIPWIEATASLVATWIWVICWPMSSSPARSG